MTTIGRDCELWPNVVVRERVTMGDRVVIHPNTTIGADGFGYLQRDGRHLKIPQIGTVTIEDDVEIGANCAVDRARTGVTRIGSGTKIDNLVQIAHNVEIGRGCIFVAQCAIGGSTRIGDHVMLGGQTGVSDHLRVGDRARIAAKSAVFKDVKEDESFRGAPATDSARFLRQQAGLRRLPKLVDELKALRDRTDELEALLTRVMNSRTRHDRVADSGPEGLDQPLGRRLRAMPRAQT
jgi:UDP-3-O-[3-hydroxymyristoyl] glucosamine N-acyltransferase